MFWSAIPFPAFDVASLPALILFEIDDDDSDEDGAGGAIFRHPEHCFVPAGSSTAIKLLTGRFAKGERWTPATVRGPPLV